MSFSYDLAPVLDYAARIINSLWPVAQISIGFGLAFSILGMIVRAITGQPILSGGGGGDGAGDEEWDGDFPREHLSADEIELLEEFESSPEMEDLVWDAHWCTRRASAA